MTIMTSKEAEEAKKPKILQRHKDSLRICFFSSFLCLLCCRHHLEQFFQWNPHFICHLFQFYFTKVFHCLVLFPLLSLNVLFLVFHCLVLFLLLSLNFSSLFSSSKISPSLLDSSLESLPCHLQPITLKTSVHHPLCLRISFLDMFIVFRKDFPSTHNFEIHFTFHS